MSLILAIVILLSACANLEENKLVGKWQAVSITEDGMPMPIPPAEVGFEFFNNGFYNYRSTLSYKEAGKFSVENGMLYTMDTLNKASTEKSVQILDIAQDSFSIKMNNEGKIQVVRLHRQ